MPAREIAYVPSGTPYGLLTAHRSLRGKRVLAVGDPDYGTRMSAQGMLLHRGVKGGRLPPLPATRKEVEAIGDVTLLGKDATEAALAAKLETPRRWRAVHLACHGLVDPERPMLSALVLTQTDEDDGFLTCLEVFRRKIPADLVVLSACETAKGRVYKAEGIVGLTRAFMYAGAPRVLCSLWKVDDKATQALMIKFYELWNPQSGSGLGAADALRKAQAHVRGHQQWEHPYYWAAWVLWGLPD